MVASTGALRTSRPLGGSAVLWAVIVIGAALALVLADIGEVREALLVGLTLSAASLVWLFFVAYRETKNAFDPVCLSAIYLFLLYPFHGFITHGAIDQLAVLGSDADLWLFYGSLVQIVSTPFFWLAYRSRAARRFTNALWSPRFVIEDTSSATFVKLLVLWVVALGARGLLLASGYAFHFTNLMATPDTLAGYQFVLNEVGKLPVFICAYLMVVGLREKRRSMLLAAAAMLLGEIAWGFVSGSRGKVIFPIVTVVAAVTYTYRVLRPRMLLAGLLVFSLVFLPFASAFRSAYYGRIDEVQRDGFDLSTITSSLVEASDNDDDPESLDIGDGPIEDLAERMHSLSSLALVMRFTPERRDYSYGASLLAMPVSVIVPSLVWPEKPQLSEFTNEFRYVYWGAAPTDPTSVAPSQLGHLWSELHIIGVLLGTLLFGLMVGVVYRYTRFGTVGDTVFPRIVLACLVPYLLLAWESPLDGWLGSLPKTVLIYIIVAWFLSARRAPRPRRS